MGGTYCQLEFGQYFAYPDHNTGHDEPVLLVHRDGKGIKIYDWKSMSGRTTEIYERIEENI